ncbi:hypothetical protein ACFSGX_14735 [Sphingomonas arantia]|uniref:DUF3617 domain-containing protein n=1 Tax=Sphingomonas arantia TaxID=1460676 RepID=A0ABW4U2F1_9SPHN
MIAVAFLLLQVSPAPPAARPCYIENKKNGRIFRTYLADRKCEEFGPPRILSGIWKDCFEGSVFHEGATDLGRLQTSKQDVWLTIDKTTVMPPGFKRRYECDAYSIRFKGRRARTEPGASSPGYGHFNAYSKMVKVDRVLQMTKLKPATARRTAKSSR